GGAGDVDHHGVADADRPGRRDVDDYGAAEELGRDEPDDRWRRGRANDEPRDARKHRVGQRAGDRDGGLQWGQRHLYGDADVLEFGDDADRDGLRHAERSGDYRDGRGHLLRG